jgi:hypothetical protein
MRSRLLVWLVVPLGCLCLGAGLEGGGPKGAPLTSERPEGKKKRLREELEQARKDVAALQEKLDAATADLAAIRKHLEAAGKRGGALPRRQAQHLGMLAARKLGQVVKSAERAASKEQKGRQERAAELSRWGSDQALYGVGFRVAKWHYRVGKYEEALELYERIRERTKDPLERLDALGGILSCQAAMARVTALRKTLEEIRRLIPSLKDEVARREWEAWVKAADAALEEVRGLDSP